MGIARLLHVFASLTPKQFLEAGTEGLFRVNRAWAEWSIGGTADHPGLGEIFPVESENHGTSPLSFLPYQINTCLVDGVVARPAPICHAG